MSGKVSVDTNILVYSCDASEPQKGPVARNQLQRLWEERRGCLSYQVLKEFYVTVAAKLSPGLAPQEAREIVRSLFAWRPVPVDSVAIERAWRLADRYSLRTSCFPRICRRGWRSTAPG
jgi:predicted nucleic acid-binding protein